MNGSRFALLLAIALAGCGGGGGAVAPSSMAPVQPASTATNATIESSIVVPGAASAQSAQSTHRSAQYISPSTLGLKIIITDIPPTGQAASFSPITAVYTLATGTNKIVVPTPATATGHSEDLTYTAYNAAPVANAIPATAKALAWGITTGFVVVPGNNVNNPVLSGVVDSFAAPLTESGSFGMMSSAPPARIGAQTSLGFGGASPASGVATMFDAGLNNIATADGGAWPVIGPVPTTATTVSTGVPVTIAETSGTCGVVGPLPHLGVSFAGGASATTGAVATTNGALVANYDGNGGAGWYAVITAKGQTQSLTYTLSSLAVTSTNTDYSCANQSLAFSSTAEATTLMTIVEHVAAEPYTLTVSNTSCPNLATVYIGATATAIAPGTPTSLGAGVNTFTIKPVAVASQTATTPCIIAIQNANAGATGGSTFPGATTYVAVLPVGYNQQTTVP